MFTSDSDVNVVSASNSNEPLGSIFNVQDDFIDSLNNDEIIHLNDDDLNQYSTWLQDITAVSSCNLDKFGILHLNINSLKNKKDSVDRILNTLQFGIVMLNETKLSDADPIEFYKNNDYRILRRDRGSGGGGVLVFILRSLNVIFTFHSVDF